MRLNLSRSAGGLAGVLLLLAGFAVAGPALAGDMGRDPIILAVPDQFPQTTFPGAAQADARAMIVRQPNRPDLIVLNPGELTPATLQAALASRDRSVHATPTPERGMAIRVTGHVVRGPQPNEARLAAALEALRRQPRARIGNLGPGRWIEVSAASLGRDGR